MNHEIPSSGADPKPVGTGESHLGKMRNWRRGAVVVVLAWGIVSVYLLVARQSVLSSRISGDIASGNVPIQDVSQAPVRGLSHPPDELAGLDVDALRKTAQEELKQRDSKAILDLKQMCLDDKAPLSVKTACWEYYAEKYIIPGMTLEEVLSDGIVQPEWITNPVNLMPISGPPLGIHSYSGEFARVHIYLDQTNIIDRSHLLLAFRLQDVHKLKSFRDAVTHPQKGNGLETLVILKGYFYHDRRVR